MNDVLLVKIGGWMYGLLPAIIGAVISFLSSRQEGSRLKLVLIFILGVGVAHFFGNATIEFFKVDPSSYMASSIILTFGLFGLATIREIFNQIPDIIKATRKRFIGE